MPTARRTVLSAAGVGALSLFTAGRADAAKVIDQYTSGAIGPWRNFAHSASSTVSARTVARDSRGVRLVGDSIARGALVPLSEAMRTRGRPLSWDAWPGRPTGPTADALAVAAKAGLLPPTLIVISGANDVFAPAAFEPALTRFLAVAGPRRRILWVTPSVQRRATPTADVRNAALVGLALERAAAANANLHLVRWFEFLAARPAQRLPGYLLDGVHPTSPKGYTALTALITAALDGR